MPGYLRKMDEKRKENVLKKIGTIEQLNARFESASNSVQEILKNSLIDDDEPILKLIK